MKNKAIVFVIIILGILCFVWSILFFVNVYNVICEMNPDSGFDFGVLMFGGLITLILGFYLIIQLIK